MTIRNRLTLRFTALVSSILLLAFVSIYAFCWYYITSDFYERLDRKAATTGDLLIRHRLDAALIRRLNQLRKDQLPDQNIVVFDARDSLIYTTHDDRLLPIAPAQLADIRQAKHTDFRVGEQYVSASRYVTAAGQFVVLASAQNVYGDGFLNRLLWALAGLLGLIVGVVALAGRLFAGDALRPMQHLELTLNHIFPDNTDERLPVGPAPDEISRLSATLNRLLDRVSETFRLQRLFVANVSHELKNPLTQISSQLEVSLLNPRSAEAYQRTIRSVLEDVTELTSLARELLQLSQVQGDNAPQLLSDQVRLDELLWDIREQVSGLHPTYQVAVDLGTLPDDPDGLLVAGNKTLLCSALKNLTENACKFSEDGRAIVRLWVDPQTVAVQVENNGQAIPAADLPYIFEPFYRSRQTADVPGSGVGLSLVERIVRLHGGSLTVSSGPGKPTVFTAKLPKLLSKF